MAPCQRRPVFCQAEFIRFFKPVFEVLRETGGSGTAAEVVDRAVEKMNISEKEQQATNKNGQSRIKNQMNWARLYLVHAGYLDSSKRGMQKRATIEWNC
jgi:restriction endonuclease Mrr